jgi:hypothetical protein
MGRSVAALTVRTRPRTPPGDYLVQLQARSSHLVSRAIVRLTIGGGSRGTGTTSVATAPFTVTGDVGNPLLPGAPQPIDLRIANPNPAPVIVTTITVRLARLSAPHAAAGLSCTSSDFSVRQYSGAYPVVIPGFRTRSLRQLGIPSAQWPRVAIVDLSTNQDGCLGASLTLAYGGRATLG